MFTYDPNNPVIDAVINEMSKKLTDIESKIADIKGTNQFIIPKPVRTRYPVIYNTNVFLIIKKIEGGYGLVLFLKGKLNEENRRLSRNAL